MTERWDRLEYGKSTVSTKGGKLLHKEASVLESVSERDVDCRKLKSRENYFGRWEQSILWRHTDGGFWLTMLV